MFVTSQISRWRPAVLAVLVAALVLSQSASAQTGLLGDVNLDGKGNILDIQGGINQSLGKAGETPEADCDGNGQVDVVDVQNMVNGVLGEGGLMQRIKGTLDCEGDPTRLRIRAVSMDGETVECDVDPQTKGFLLRLRVKTAWAIALCEQKRVNNQDQEQCLGTFEFGVDGQGSCTMPIPELSRCSEVSLGEQLQVGPQGRIQSQSRVQRMLGQMAEPIDATDANGNGMPDFCEPLMMRVRERAQDGPGGGGGGGGGAGSLDIEPLLTAMGLCIEPWLDELTIPDLTDSDANGIPDSVEVLFTCLDDTVQAWLVSQGVEVPQVDNNANGIPDFVDAIIAHVEQGIPAWLLGLNRPEFVDADANGIPDYIEHHLSVAGIPSYVDPDGDGVPDFAEDHDGDGIPNIVDADYVPADDCDCDGVPNNVDIDKDGDGVPNYADADPMDPNVA